MYHESAFLFRGDEVLGEILNKARHVFVSGESGVFVMQNDNIMGRPLGPEDIAQAANQLGVTEAHVRAVIDVEARGTGFIGQYENELRLPTILFEAHIFSRETGGTYDNSHPQISSPVWNRALYKGGIAEHDRLHEAATLDFDAAYRSASWGLFQIMGSNHKAAGYPQLRDFIGVQFVSEGMQLQCGVNFILSEGLERHLQSKDWAAFARSYNGRAYAENRYDEKLAEAFERFSSDQFEKGSWVREVQEALNHAGFNLTVDGIMGGMTKAAIREFQRQKGLVVDGIVGPATKKALGIS